MYQSSNRRDYDRRVFAEPVRATIELSTPYEDVQSLGLREIIVLDMSAGGIKFACKTEFTVNHLAIYKIEMNLSEKDLTMYGKIIRKRKLTQGFFEYGLRFDYDYKDQKKLKILYD
ncbi:PilZ domain-containing protein [Pseudalkalibacillus sp. SCS-8]|uniref:PilZ domain-containing protein n=1 Tax=Pseudalkalibacillus nanhaiensis TaxID=3115291 RepID=UPI0032DA9B69